ncbi:TPA_asm: RNA-directed RNA polymerase [ssRNA phage Gephyllon.3_17]|uniref:RNA-directed RNA polymerase n=2 Tax=Norzivirales TaxID=2842247 RepID=A0A8S5KY66_9VIRU|nr:RNA-directed RNA polymerase [ssRNA phage Gephyllon.3_17]QDH91189.1 MAG: RNA-dependent RNA polymerase [Leviviridae sp.]DAD50240.1 TPA_asm: RNA-directed RNA polymerase [ssRNA phage Gephyllon.3_17]
MGISPKVLFSNLQTDLQSQISNEIADAAGLAILNSFYKKFVDNEKEDAESKAFAKFEQSNLLCSDWQWPTTDEANLFLQRLKHVLWKWESNSCIGALSFDHLFDRIRVGPGAAVKAAGPDFYTKVGASVLSVGRPSLGAVYTAATRRIPLWNRTELCRSARFGEPVVVEGNTMSFVPKTDEIKRSICVEPSINMMYELALGSFIEDGLRKEFGLDLALQPDKNRELARIGSVTGSFGTIDLESASDSLALSMVRALLPRTFWFWLDYLRSPTTTYKGTSIELHMVSTMGNGFTFPLQTLLFAGVVIATANELGISLSRPHRCLGNWGVFGDDIIVPTEMYSAVVCNLELLGFRVNSSKSFNQGPFRESCGHDYFRGHNIRGVYVKSLNTVQDRFVLVNRLLDWTARTLIGTPQTTQALLSTVPDFPVPLGENDDAGFRVPLLYLKKRIRDKHCQSLAYKRFEARPTAILFRDEIILTPRGVKKRYLNPDGAYLAQLQGSLRGNRIPIRHDWVRYSKRTGICPNWDHVPMGHGFYGRVGLGQLETAFLLNSGE